MTENIDAKIATKVMVVSKKEVLNLESSQVPSKFPNQMINPICKPILEKTAQFLSAPFPFYFGILIQI